MAGTALAAHSRRFVVVLGIAALIALAPIVHGWPSSRPVRATGNTITVVDSPGDVGDTNSLVLDSSGRPVISYFDSTNNALKVVHCGTADCTSGNTITSPDTAERVGLWSSIALDSLGDPVISYINDLYAELRVIRCGDAACTTGNTITVVAAAYDFQNQTSLVLDASFNPAISYYSGYPLGGLWILSCGSADCSSGNATTSLDSRDGRWNSLALDALGNPVISYLNDQDLLVIHCGTATCASGNVITQLDSYAGGNTSLQLDASGNPVISYSDLAHQDLKLIHCGNATCASGNTIASPDTAGSVGGHSSLELDTAGHPVVSYYDYTNGNLKVLHCGDPNCLLGNAIATADDADADVGWWTSLELDPSGNPVVSYYDLTNRDLKLLHCGDPTCNAPIVPTSTPTLAASATRTQTPTSTATVQAQQATPTRTTHPPPLGGVADYPNVSGGSSAWPFALLATTIGLLVIGGVGLYARRQKSSMHP